MTRTGYFIVVITYLVLAIIVILSIVNANNNEKQTLDDRFITIEKYNDGYYITVDRYTGVKYICRNEFNIFGISPLYDENGNVEILNDEELQAIISK